MSRCVFAFSHNLGMLNVLSVEFSFTSHVDHDHMKQVRPVSCRAREVIGQTGLPIGYLRPTIIGSLKRVLIGSKATLGSHWPS